MNRFVDRRALLRLGAGGTAVVGAASALPLLLTSRGEASDGAVPPSHGGLHQDDGPHEHGPGTTVGDVDVSAMRIDPSTFLTMFDYGEPTMMADGTVVREWEIVALD